MSRNRIIKKAFIIIWTFYSVNSILFTATTLSEQYASVHGIYQLCSICTIVLLLFLCFYVRWYSPKRLLFYVLTMIFILGIAVISRGTNVLIGIMFMLLASYTDVKELIRFDMKLKLTLLALIFLLCRFGILENKVGYAADTYKQSLGFVNQNLLAAFVCIIVLEWLFLCYETAKKYQYFIVFVILYILNYISKGRTSIYSLLTVIFLFILANFKPQIFYTKRVKGLFMLITPILALSSFLMSHLYLQGNIFVMLINRWMTNRIRYAADALLKNNVRLMGGSLSSGATLDMGYVYCVLRFGLVFLICTCLVYSIQFSKFLEKKQINIVLFMLFYVISGLGEGFMFNIVFNVSMLYLFCFESRIKTADCSIKV